MSPVGTGTVAKKKSESRRFNTLVRMDDELVERAKKVAALKGTSLAEYFGAVLTPIVAKDLAKEAKKLAEAEAAD